MGPHPHPHRHPHRHEEVEPRGSQRPPAAPRGRTPSAALAPPPLLCRPPGPARSPCRSLRPPDPERARPAPAPCRQPAGRARPPLPLRGRFLEERKFHFLTAAADPASPFSPSPFLRSARVYTSVLRASEEVVLPRFALTLAKAGRGAALAEATFELPRVSLAPRTQPSVTPFATFSLFEPVFPARECKLPRG